MALSLNQWLNETGVIRSNRHHIADIAHFGFGEAGYYVMLARGQSHFDNDLDRILDVLLTEADTANWGISMTFGDAKAPLGGNRLARRKSLDLLVHLSQPMPGRGEYNARQVAHIRQLVTLFNLTGKWEEFSKSNL